MHGRAACRLLASTAVSRTRTERLVNLVICLLSTRRFLTAAQIAATVPGYEHDPDDARDHEAFQRKFERDKAELRELGVPLETGTASVFDAEPGYRIAHREYALPDILLEPDEAAAVGIAARLWQHAGLAAAASSGLAKLRAAGVDVDPQATLGLEPMVTVDPAFAPLTAAARDRREVSVRLPGARPGRAQPPPAAAVGRGLLARPVVCGRPRPGPGGDPLLPAVPGRRRGPGDRRAGRATSRRPNVDLISHVARWSGPVERTGRATVLAAPGRAAGLRRWAVEATAGPDGDRLVLPYADPDGLAGQLVGYGPDVRVLDPPEVREAVIQRLKEIAARHDELAVSGGAR